MKQMTTYRVHIPYLSIAELITLGGTYIEHVSSLVLNGKLMILLICAQQKLLANCLHVIVNRKLFRLESHELNHRVYTILIQNHLVAQDSLKKYSPTCNVSVVNTSRTRN